MTQEYFVAPLVQQNARKANGDYRWSTITVHEGCVWTSLANAIANAAGKTYSPDYVHSKVPREDEVNRYTPGWHMDDAALAAKRLGFTLENHHGDKWEELVAYSDAGYTILLQGDSDQFSNATCSGVFDGLHCIVVHPEKNAAGQRLVYDPICKTFRWEWLGTLRKYAQKLADNVPNNHGKLFWGRLVDKVARVDLFKLYPGAQKTVPFPDRVRFADDIIHVHNKPKNGQATVVSTIRDQAGKLWLPAPYQRIKVDGDWWFGNKVGSRWIEDTQLTHEGGST